MASYKKYETKPIDCWQKGKELSSAYQQNPSTVKAQGKVLGMGLANFANSLPAAFEDSEFIDFSTYLPTFITKTDLAAQCFEAVGARGFSTNICHAVQLIWGSMFLNSFPFADSPPDYWLQFHYCESLGKGAQLVGEHYGIPYFCIDIPIIRRQEKEEFHLNYLVSQLHDAVEWIEKVTGKKCQDEKLIEGVHNEFQSAALLAKILELNKTIPAPLDTRALNSLCGSLIDWKHKRETVEFLQTLYDEVEDRVRNQIAALATERCRLFHEGATPLAFIRDFSRHVQRYGAVFIGSTANFVMSGGFEREAGGSWRAIKTLEERGIRRKNRNDALRAIAQYWLNHTIADQCRIAESAEDVVQRAEDWRINGIIFHCDCGCQVLPTGMLEAKLALREKNILSVVYEGSAFNPQDVVKSDIINLLDTFLQALGLNQLEE